MSIPWSQVKDRRSCSGRVPIVARRLAYRPIGGRIDRCMSHTHRLIIGEVNAQATGDLLRAPALSPAPVLARSVTAPAPADLRTRNAPVGPLHSPGKPVLH